MGTVSTPQGRSRWSIGTGVILLASLIGVAFMYSSVVFGLGDSSTSENIHLSIMNDYEIGDNDFRISDMGPDGDITYDADTPAIAYNSTNHEYLVVWSGKDGVNTGREIYGQRIDATTGEELGENDFRISQMTVNIDSTYMAITPDVVYNPFSNEYLVVWKGMVFGEQRTSLKPAVFGQRLDAATGTAVGEDDLLIDRFAKQEEYDVFWPAVAHNSAKDEYLIVWIGSPTQAYAFEVMGQRLTNTGKHAGETILAISDALYNWPLDVAYHANANEYLIVWSSYDESVGVEIFAQRLEATTGKEIGINDFRVSNMGGDDASFDFIAESPVVAYNSTTQEYLVVWSGGWDVDPGTLNGHIFAQRLNAAGEELEDDFRISDTGNEIGYWSNTPSAVYNAIDNEYLITWSLEDVIGEPRDKNEIYGQRLDGITGVKIGVEDFRISDAGPEGDRYYTPSNPVVAHSRNGNMYLVAWSGDDNTGSLVKGEYEILGQQLVWQRDVTPTATQPATSTNPAETIAPTATITSVVPTLTPTSDTPPLIDPWRVFLPLIKR